MSNELKICPFCGGYADLIKVTNGYASGDGAITDAFLVQCNDCGINTKRYKSDIRISDNGEVIINHNGAQEAIVAWNRRVIDE